MTNIDAGLIFATWSTIFLLKDVLKGRRQTAEAKGVQLGIRLKEDVNGSANFSRQFRRKQRLGCSIGLVFEPNVGRRSFGLSGAERLYWGNQADWLHWCWMAAIALLASLSGPPPNHYIKLCHVWPVLLPSEAPKSLFVPL